MAEFNEAMKEVENKREMIWNDVQWHCGQSYFILLQAISATMKEMGEHYEKCVAIFQQFKPTIESAQQLQVRMLSSLTCERTNALCLNAHTDLWYLFQPDKSLQVKADDLTIVYGDSDEACTVSFVQVLVCEFS